MMPRRWIPFVLFLVTNVSKKNEMFLVLGSDDCPLDCQQDAPCIEGNANFTGHPTLPNGTPLPIHEKRVSNGMHCACPHGWTGLTCNHIFETCDKDHKCYNGGRCIPGLDDIFGNEQLFCDCSRAVDANGDTYVGKFCEHQQLDTCDDLGTFCVNGGECNPLFPGRGTPCNCQSDYEGPHCEFLKGSVPKCDLECQNGGSCSLGLPTLSRFHDLQHFHNTSSFQQCICPPGFAGTLCEISKTSCGSHHCFHGGTCISRQDASGVTKFHCDCTTANDNGNSHAGRFCQYESTSFCSRDPDQNGELFCVNGGTCRDETHEGCECTAEFTGPSCEFRRLPDPLNATDNTGTVTVSGVAVPNSVPPVNQGSNSNNSDNSNGNNNGNNSDNDNNSGSQPTGGSTIGAPKIPEPVPQTCDLKCENDGSCRRGVKDLGILSDIAPHVSNLNKTFDQNFEHCVCPKGFVGLRCEHRIEICPENQHLCLHGSKCVKYGEEWSCNCREASAPFSAHLAGESCEHHATGFCTLGPLEPGKPRSFCVNGGTCKAQVNPNQPHPGCNCAVEWTGPHCELLKANLQQTTAVVPEPLDQNTDSGGGNRGFTTFVLVLSVFALVAAAAILLITWNRKVAARRRAELLNVHGNLAAMSMPSIAYTDNPPIQPGKGAQYRQIAAQQQRSINLALGEDREGFVNIGPPRDEDGHELHNVEIL